MNAPDTSVAVAAALPWHESHAASSAALGGGEAALLAHVAVETYSVLTRLPPPQRVPPPVALAYLRETFDEPPLPLSADGYARLVERAADESITGGAVYDALVAATALEAGATLLTLDRRAVTTYRLLGAAYRLVA